MPDLQLARVDPGSPGALALREAYRAELFALTGSPLVRTAGADDAELVPPAGALWAASLDGAPVGCVGVRTLDGATVEVKRLYVSPAARGHRLGATLLGTAEEWAAARGASRAVLDTRSELAAACALYRSAGWVQVEPFNDNPAADLWFAKALGVGRP